MYAIGQSGQLHPPRAGPCDDTNACTQNDRCQGTTCAGDEVTCDDGLECTLDSCDPVAGCQKVDLDVGACETGNYCTNDYCADGACVQGALMSCPSDTCNQASCNIATGCDTNPLTGNTCNDDDPCTVEDECSNGNCIGGSSYCTGRPCSNCAGEWNLELGGWCADIGGSPICFCICL
jgi:hypothetical protein